MLIIMCDIAFKQQTQYDCFPKDILRGIPVIYFLQVAPQTKPVLMAFSGFIASISLLSFVRFPLHVFPQNHPLSVFQKLVTLLLSWDIGMGATVLKEITSLFF